MPKSEEGDNENIRFIIYHGHIHIISKNDKNQEIEPPSNVKLSRL
jgi:hypothetical protein